MSRPDFVEPRRECAKRTEYGGRRCGTHVVWFNGAWWCGVCHQVRSMSSTVAVLGAPPKPKRRQA